jgi:hypothetical protein
VQYEVAEAEECTVAQGDVVGWYHAGQGVTSYGRIVLPDGTMGEVCTGATCHDVHWHYGDHPGVGGLLTFDAGGGRDYSVAASVVYGGAAAVGAAQAGWCHTDAEQDGPCMWDRNYERVTERFCADACVSRAWCIAYSFKDGGVDHERCRLFAATRAELVASGSFTEQCGGADGRVTHGNGWDQVVCHIMGGGGGGAAKPAPVPAAAFACPFDLTQPNNGNSNLLSSEDAYAGAEELATNAFDDSLATTWAVQNKYGDAHVVYDFGVPTEVHGGAT